MLADISGQEECAICWAPYEKSTNTKIVKLGCNDKHSFIAYNHLDFFHSECIEGWIKSGKNSCPLCREPISEEVSI